MTSHEWQNCRNPFMMIQALPTSTARRKLILCGCAIVRSRWDTLADQPGARQCIETGESLADGQSVGLSEYPVERVVSSEGVAQAARRIPCLGIKPADLSLLIMRGGRGDHPLDLTYCADVFRDVIGHPQHKPHRRDHEVYWGDGTHQQDWWLTPQVKELAQMAYQERPENGVLERDRLMILADALEDAGLESERQCVTCMGKGFFIAGPEGLRCPACKNHLQNQWLPDANACPRMRCAACKEVWTPMPCGQCKGKKRTPQPLLQHLRSEGPHVRGCWGLDLLLRRT